MCVCLLMCICVQTGAVQSPQGPPPKEAFDAVIDRTDDSEAASMSEYPEEATLALETSTVDWTSDDPDAVIVSKLKNAAGRTSGILEERVRVCFELRACVWCMAWPLYASLLDSTAV